MNRATRGLRVAPRRDEHIDDLAVVADRPADVAPLLANSWVTGEFEFFSAVSKESKNTIWK